MSDLRRWQRRARVLFGGAIAVALLWPCVSLVRETTAHDWYAAVKLTVTEAMIAAGFSPLGTTHYRGPDGTIFSITRRGLTEYGVPIEARERIRYTALVGTLHGGFAGALWVVLWAMFWRPQPPACCQFEAGNRRAGDRADSAFGIGRAALVPANLARPTALHGRLPAASDAQTGRLAGGDAPTVALAVRRATGVQVTMRQGTVSIGVMSAAPLAGRRNVRSKRVSDAAYAAGRSNMRRRPKAAARLMLSSWLC